MDKILVQVQSVLLNLKITKKRGINKSEKPMIEPWFFSKGQNNL